MKSDIPLIVPAHGTRIDGAITSQMSLGLYSRKNIEAAIDLATTASISNLKPMTITTIIMTTLRLRGQTLRMTNLRGSGNRRSRRIESHIILAASDFRLRIGRNNLGHGPLEGLLELPWRSRSTKLFIELRPFNGLPRMQIRITT